jgi:hypothetical protein
MADHLASSPVEAASAFGWGEEIKKTADGGPETDDGPLRGLARRRARVSCLGAPIVESPVVVWWNRLISPLRILKSGDISPNWP